VARARLKRVLGFHYLWNPSYQEPGLKERQPFPLWTIQERAFGLALQLKLWFIELLCAKF
jgi:hypothetical protein